MRLFSTAAALFLAALPSSTHQSLLKSYAEVVANVSLLLANFHAVNCVQIFYGDDLSDWKRETIYDVWKTLAKTESRVTTGVYSYHRYLERKKARPRKVSCYRSLKIMSNDEGSRKGYIQFSEKVTIRDAVWVLFDDSLTVEFFNGANVLFDDVLIIAVIKTSELVVFHEIYKISHDRPLKVLPMGNWTRSGGLFLPEKPFYDRRSDLEGIVLRTASVRNWPATYRRNGKWDGFLIKVWNEIKSLINCTSAPVRVRENYIGMRMQNGSWNGLVGMLVRNEIDILISEIVIDKKRSHILKFFYPLTKTRFQIYTRDLGYGWQWTSVLKPFHKSIWFAALGWVLVGTVVIALSYNITVSYGLEKFTIKKVYTPIWSFLFVLQALSQQGYHITPRSFTCRILFFVSYAVSAVLIPSYSASLVSSLAQKTPYKSFDSLREMVDLGTYRLIVKENSAQHAFFAYAKDDFLKKAYETLSKDVPKEYMQMGLRHSLKQLCNLPGYAVMGIEEIIEVRMTGKRKPECPIVALNNPVSTIHLTMATAKTSPFHGLINHHLEKLLFNGIISRLKLMEFKTPIRPKVNADENVGLSQLISAFAFIGFFMLVSILILLLEIEYHMCVGLKTNRTKIKRRPRLLHQDHSRLIYEYELKLARRKNHSMY